MCLRKKILWYLESLHCVVSPTKIINLFIVVYTSCTGLEILLIVTTA